MLAFAEEELKLADRDFRKRRLRFVLERGAQSVVTGGGNMSMNELRKLRVVQRMGKYCFFLHELKVRQCCYTAYGANFSSENQPGHSLFSLQVLHVRNN